MENERRKIYMAHNKRQKLIERERLSLSTFLLVQNWVKEDWGQNQIPNPNTILDVLLFLTIGLIFQQEFGCTFLRLSCTFLHY